MKNKVQTIFKFNYYGCEKSYNQHRVQIECDDTCNYEHHCRSKSARSSRRSGLCLSSAFYYLFAAVVFLIPTAMVLRSWRPCSPTNRAVYSAGSRKRYGARTGFLAIWLQWIESTIWYPTVLTFGAVSIAFIGMNETYDMSLASNKVFTLIVVLAIYWVATLVSLKGMDWVGKISKWEV